MSKSMPMSMALFKEPNVNYITLDKSVAITSPYSNNNRIARMLKKNLSTSQSNTNTNTKGLQLCSSLTKFPNKESYKRTGSLSIFHTHKSSWLDLPCQKSKYQLSKGCELSDIFKKEPQYKHYRQSQRYSQSNKPIIKEAISPEPKLFLPVMKSPYRLIEELKTSVDHAVMNKSNGLLIHQMKSDYYIKKMNKDNIQRLKRTKKNQRQALSEEEQAEANDKVILDDKEELKLKKSIRVFLGAKDSKFNQVVEMTSDHFFDLLPNRVNFSQDVYVVPLLMCKLSKFPVTRANQLEYFNCKNNISPGILRYLYSLRVAIQRENDQQKKTLRKIWYDEDKSDEALSPSSSSPFYQYDAKNDYLRLMKIVTPISGITIYEIEDFFIHKYIRYENIQIASDREKDFILNHFGDMSHIKYQTRHIPKLIASLK